MRPDVARSIAKAHLSEKRMYHSECVARCAKQLAVRLGCDAEDAEVAGLLHDVLKEEDDSALLKTMEGSAIMRDDYVEHYRPIWHAFAGSIYVRKELGLSQEIADAIFYHTCGRASMTPLEKAIFLADYISDDRAFEGAQEVREIAAQDIDKAVLQALKNTISHLISKGRVVMPLSIEAYNYYASLSMKSKD